MDNIKYDKLRINHIYRNCTIILLITTNFLLRYTYVGFEFALCNSILLYIIIYLLNKGIYESTILNPYYLFLITPLSLYIYDSSISNFFFLPLSNSTLWFAIANFIFFILALNRTKKTVCFKDNFLHNRKSLIYYGWLLFIISSLSKIIVPLASILSLLFYPAVACILKSKSKINFALMMTIWLLMYMNNLNKTTFLGVIVLIILCIQSYYNVKMRSKTMFLGLILACFGMYVMFDLKAFLADGGSFISFFTEKASSSEIGGDSLNYYGDRVDWNLSGGLLLPYMYLTTAWTNVQYVIETQSNHTFGLWFIKPILGWFQIDDIFESKYQLDAMTSFNTFTYLSILYKDFGYYGSILVSYFLGYFVKRVYNDYCVSSSPLVLGCYACCALATLEMFFSNHFFGQSYPFTIIIVCLFFRFVINLINRNKIYPKPIPVNDLL